MRWFLIIVVAPIAILNLPRLFTLFSHSSGYSSSAGSGGSADLSEAERERLLQLLAEAERREALEKQPQVKSTTQQSPSPAPANVRPPTVLVLNGDPLGMTAAEFERKYPREYKDRSQESLSGPKGRYGTLNSIVLDVNSGNVIGAIPAKTVAYQFINGNFGKLETSFERADSAALIASLTEQLKMPPKEIDLARTSEAGFPGNDPSQPQLRWENDRVRVTLTPAEGNKYRFKVLDKIHAKPMIDMYTDMGRPPK